MSDILLMKDEQILLEQHGNINKKEGQIVLTNQRLFLKADAAVKSALRFGLIGAVVQGATKTVNINISDIKAIGPMNKSGFEILTCENKTIKGAFAKGVGLLTVNGQIATSKDVEARDTLLRFISQQV